jgi:hypothetical protein
MVNGENVGDDADSMMGDGRFRTNRLAGDE